MPLIAAYHATGLRCRDGIIERGLLPNQPKGDRPYGVYVFHEDFAHPAWRSRTVWGWGDGQDLWEVGYFGRLIMDQYVCNAMVLLDTPQIVTLVTGHK